MTEPSQQQSPSEPPSPTVQVPKNLIASLLWVAGAMGLVGGAYLGAKSVIADLNEHWRLESIAKEKDSESERKLKEATDKAATDLKEHQDKDVRDIKRVEEKLDASSLDANRGRAWVVWSLADFKASFLKYVSQQCRKDPKADCRQAEADASEASADARAAKPPNTPTTAVAPTTPRP